MEIDPKKLRVAIYSDSLPERNGAGAYYHDLADQLKDRLGSLMLYQPKPRSWYQRFALPLPGDKTQKLIFPNIFRLTKQFRQQKPHLVIAVTPGPFGMLGLWMAKRSGAGFITAFHTHFEGLMQLYGDTIFFRTAYWYLELINKILCKYSETVLINNEGLVPTIKRLGAPKHDLMGTPVALEFLEAELVPPRGELKQVLFAGRLAPEKNLSVVIDAARAHPDLDFVLVGDGPLRQHIQKESADLDNVRMTGWLDRIALRKEVDDADLLILPSHMETFGTVALEAMARGRPALVSASAGIHEWEELHPALFKLSEGEKIAQTLAELKKLPAEAWEVKAKAARAAAEVLNNKTIEQWVGFAKFYARTTDGES